MSARAHVREQWERQSLGIAVMRDTPGSRQLVTWPSEFLTIRTLTTEDERAAEQPDAWLSLPEDIARALYEALAEHYGHTGNDVRALRRDYDAERNRVDLLIRHAIGTHA